MKAKVQPYTLEQAKILVADQVTRMRPVHDKWRALERLWASGSIEEAVASSADPGATSRLYREVLPIPTEGVNLVLPHLNMHIGTIVDTDPPFSCTPVGYGDGYNDAEEDAAAKAAEATIGYWFRRAKGRKVLSQMAKDIVLLGPAFAKVGWNLAEIEVDKTDDEWAADVAAAVADADDDADLDEVTATVTMTRTQTVHNAPFIEYVAPYDLFADSSAHDVTDARWVAHRVLKPADEVRVDLDLDDDVALEPYRGGTAWVAEGVSYRDPSTESFALVEFYEFHDLRTRQVLVFQATSSEPLYAGPTPYNFDRVTFAHITNYRRNAADFYGFGDLENVAGLQAMLNEVFARQIDNMGRANAKVLMDESLMTDETRDALEDPTHGVVVPVNTGGQDLTGRIHVVETPPLPADIYNASGTMQDFMAQVLGLSELQQGQLSAASRVSGTAAAALEGYSNVRSAGKQSAIADAATQIGELLLALSQQFMDEAIALKIAGPDGKRTLRRITVDDISGDYEVVVEAGSTTRANPAVREQRALEILNVVLPAVTSYGYDPAPFLADALRGLSMSPERLVKLDQAGTPAAPAGPAGPVPGLPEPAAGLPDTPEELGLPASPQALGMGLAEAAHTEGGVVL